MASCVLLGGQDFLAAHGAALAGTLAHSIDSVGEKGLLALMPVRMLAPDVQPHACLHCANGDNAVRAVASAAGKGLLGFLLLHTDACGRAIAWLPGCMVVPGLTDMPDKHVTMCAVCVQVLELLLMGWPGEAAALLQQSLLRVLALALSGRETSLVVAGVCIRDAASEPMTSIVQCHAAVTHGSTCAAAGSLPTAATVTLSMVAPVTSRPEHRHLHCRRCVRLRTAAAAQHGCIPAAVPHSRRATRLCSCGRSGSHQRQQQRRSSAGTAACAARPVAGQDGCHRLQPAPCCCQQRSALWLLRHHMFHVRVADVWIQCMSSCCEQHPVEIGYSHCLPPQCAGAPPARKLSAAALAAALTLPVPPIADRLDLIVAHITSVCYEVGASLFDRCNSCYKQ
jgi:hypothetical protein